LPKYSLWPVAVAVAVAENGAVAVVLVKLFL
jgi:hypothetical protein